ncbi:DUF5906 domain-containing protein [uncultured Desulfosarcina sp.]|uniref:phage NrS-1 polymerase family protein n=1 Tax=uncultured Desulfosarcina sp. TaxID=218289 RepID=UPI0029C85DF3|nr:DUF5906 domain-containing protein [uncultured Desulfosarcina sp.]
MKTPNFLQVIPENIPGDLKSYIQLVAWKAVLREEKWTKVPYVASSGRKARVNNPHDWTDFETAFRAYQESKGNFDGIGFVLTEKDPIAGIDIDEVIKPGEKLELEKLPKKVKDIVCSLNTYTEISPSGTGLRLFVLGSLPKSGRKKGPFEFYESGRFLTITGHHLEGTPKNIQSRQQQLTEAHASVFGKATVQPKPTKARSLSFSDDSQIMQHMLQSASGGKIQRLLSGDYSGYPSQSEADQALCGYLAFWYGRNAGLMDAVFKSSGLYREKWDRKHHSDGRTYGQATIERAISQCNEVYTPAMTNRPNELETEKPISDEQLLKDYRKIDEPDQEQIRAARAAVVRTLNRDHGTCMVGGKFQVIFEHKNPITERPDFSLLNRQDFRFRYENKSIIVGYTKGKPTFATLADIWLKSPWRREYDGITFDPANKTSRLFNMYKPATLTFGPGTCELFLEFIKDVICSGNEEIYEWLIDWVAWLYQHKGRRRPGTAFVMRGVQGCGKGTLVKFLGELFGIHFIHIVHQNQITGRFNGHLKYGILVFIDEAVYGGDKKAEGILKGFVTEDTILVENKFVDPFEIRNHCNFIFASNNIWIIPAGFEERRFTVSLVSDKRVGDTKYWKKLYHEMENGGVADLAKFLLARKVTSNLRFAPRTLEYLNQVLETMQPEQQFWFHCLQEGDLPDPSEERPSEGWPNLISRDGLYLLYERFCDKINVRNRRLSHAQLQRRLQEMVDVYGGPRKAFAFGGKRFRTWRLPPLTTCREQFEAKLKYKINWDDDDQVPF